MNSQGFIKLLRCHEDRAEWLASRYPKAFSLLAIIALRARRSDDPITGLNKGECFIGEWAKWGWTEGEYIQAKKILCKEKFISCIEFHHIDSSKKVFSLSAFNQYGKKTIMKEFKKCIVLCSNCHNKIHFVRDEIFHIIKWIWF